MYLIWTDSLYLFIMLSSLLCTVESLQAWKLEVRWIWHQGFKLHSLLWSIAKTSTSANVLSCLLAGMRCNVLQTYVDKIIFLYSVECLSCFVRVIKISTSLLKVQDFGSCSPVLAEKKLLEVIGKKLKKNNVALDIVSFGEEDSGENGEKLEALLGAVNSNDNSHIVHIPWGERPLSDILIRSVWEFSELQHAQQMFWLLL